VTDLTETDVIDRIPSVTGERLRVLSRRPPVTVAPGTSLADCLHEIQTSGTGNSVFVVESGDRLVGVLTERDVFAHLVGGEVDLAEPVEGLMTRAPKTLDIDQTIEDVIVLMQTGRYRNVPIVDAERTLVGVVRQSDVIRYLAESFPEELLNLPPRPNQTMEESEGA
jgi:CBS domain-containing protein